MDRQTLVSALIRLLTDTETLRIKTDAGVGYYRSLANDEEKMLRCHEVSIHRLGQFLKHHFDVDIDAILGRADW